MSEPHNQKSGKGGRASETPFSLNPQPLTKVLRLLLLFRGRERSVIHLIAAISSGGAAPSPSSTVDGDGDGDDSVAAITTTTMLACSASLRRLLLFFSSAPPPPDSSLFLALPRVINLRGSPSLLSSSSSAHLQCPLHSLCLSPSIPPPPFFPSSFWMRFSLFFPFLLPPLTSMHLLRPPLPGFPPPTSLSLTPSSSSISLNRHLPCSPDVTATNEGGGRRAEGPLPSLAL